MVISILELEEAVGACRSLKGAEGADIIDGFVKRYADAADGGTSCAEELREMLFRIINNGDGLGQAVAVLAKRIRSMPGWKVDTDIYEYIKGTAHVEDAVRGQLKRAGNYSCIDIARSSNAVDDHYLYNVLARNDRNGSYVVWTYNDSLKSLECGKYDLELKEALELFWDISWY